MLFNSDLPCVYLISSRLNQTLGVIMGVANRGSLQRSTNALGHQFCDAWRPFPFRIGFVSPVSQSDANYHKSSN